MFQKICDYNSPGSFDTLSHGPEIEKFPDILFDCVFLFQVPVVVLSVLVSHSINIILHLIIFVFTICPITKYSHHSKVFAWRFFVPLTVAHVQIRRVVKGGQGGPEKVQFSEQQTHYKGLRQLFLTVS